MGSLQFGRFTVRQATPDDIPGVTGLDNALLGEVALLPADHFANWLDAHPEGFKVALSPGGEIVAYAMAIRLGRADVHHNWLRDTAGGTCRSHDPRGDVLYGVSCVSRSPGAGLGVVLAERHLVEETPGLSEAWLYGRLRHFGAWRRRQETAGSLDALLQEYVMLHTDPTQLFYESAGGMAARGVTDYITDHESLNCAVLTRWSKPR